MESKPSVPQTPSKIPKLVAPPSTLSPRGRTPSFIIGEEQTSPVSPAKIKRGLSSPRQPISFRVQTTPSTPISPRLTHQQSSIKSKSNDETTRQPLGVAAFAPIDVLPDVMEDDTAPAIATQGGEGDMPTPLALRADRSEMKVKSEVFPLKEMESRMACSSADVNVLYTANPMRMDSIVSVSTPTPQQKKSPTYLDLYEREAMESLETIKSVQALGSIRNVSLEWDFAAGGGEERHEIYTQTSGTRVETIDRASSAMPLPSFSKESLLDQQTTPLAVLDALTTEEECEGDEVSYEMSSYAYDCFAHEVEGEEEKYDFSPLITTKPAEEEEEEVVVKVGQKEKPQSQFTPRCYMDMDDKARYQEISQDYGYDDGDEIVVKEVFSLEIPMEPERGQSTFLEETQDECGGDGDGGSFMVAESEELGAEGTLPPASIPRQRSSHLSQHAIAVTQDIDPSRNSLPRQLSSVHHPSQHAIAPEVVQSSSSFPRQRSSVHRRPSQQSVSAQKLATSSASVPQQRSSRSIYQETPEPRVAQAPAQSTASIPHQQKSSKIPLPEWQVENLKPKLSISASGGAIEIQPPPVQMSPDDLMDLKWRHEEQNRLSAERLEAAESRESTSMFSPVQSMIILEQCSANFGKGMRGALEICNSTSFLQGFKVVGNYATKKDLKFTPEIGLIPPHSKATVSVSSNSFTVCHPYDADNYCVWVHMFRAYCTDVHKLKEYYSNLERQHPELIQTSQINKFIIWNNDDLPGMLEMINSVHDEMEREALMDEIHRHQSSNSVHIESSLDRLENLQITMMKSNSNLQQLGRALCDIRNSAQLFIFVALMIYGMVFLLPYLHEIRPPVAEPVVPESKAEDCILCVSSWSERMSNTYQYIKSYF